MQQANGKHRSWQYSAKANPAFERCEAGRPVFGRFRSHETEDLTVDVHTKTVQLPSFVSGVLRGSTSRRDSPLPQRHETIVERLTIEVKKRP